MNGIHLALAPATPDDLPQALDLLDNAAQWLISMGIEQWQSPLPASFVAFMQAETAAGHVYLAWTGQGDPPAATVRIAHDDVPRWHDDGQDNALYVYSLAIRKDLHGLGVGRRVLCALAEMAAGQGKGWLRLDCWARNTRLKDYYASMGFQHAGDVLDHGFPLSLYGVRISSGNRPALACA
jgi:ribosomal protein S18 acetylase RimI-like enzyme